MFFFCFAFSAFESFLFLSRNYLKYSFFYLVISALLWSLISTLCCTETGRRLRLLLLHLHLLFVLLSINNLYEAKLVFPLSWKIETLVWFFFCFVLAGIRLKFLVSFQQLVLCVCLIVCFYTLISFFFC